MSGSDVAAGARYAVSTIAAVATPPGAGGISIIRLSGPAAGSLLSKFFLPLSPSFEGFRPWCLHRGRALDANGKPLDDVLAVFMPGPRTFTGEDMAEIHCHGGPFLVQTLLESLLRMGAIQAGRGEFSRRAFCNGRLDLSQAEAVAELIAAPSREALQYSLNRLDGLLARRVASLSEAVDGLRVQMSLAVDFPDDEVDSLEPQALRQDLEKVIQGVRQLLECKRRAQVMQCGACVVLAGAVNAGKSSLLNALLGRERALVSDIPGTTRDFLEEPCDLDGLPVRLVDTAGLRYEQHGGTASADVVEHMGMELSRQRLSAADAVLLVLDGAALGTSGAEKPECPDSIAAQVLELAGTVPVIIVWNKSDLCRPTCFPPLWGRNRPSVCISARNGDNIDILVQLLRQAILDDGGNAPTDGLAPNARQALALEGALQELEALREDILAGLPWDCCTVHLDTAAARLEEVTGHTSPAEVLDRVFSHFCIGK